MCPCALIAFLFVVLLLWALRPGAKTLYTLPTGMPYIDGVAQLHRETERTQFIILEWARIRTAQIDRLEII